MRKPSRASVILLITTPIIGCILLWYVLFPGVESEGIQGLSSWGSSNYYGEDGDMAGGDSESSGGFDEIKSQSTTGYTNTQGNSAGSINDKTYASNESSSDYKPNYNETANTSVNNEIPVITNRSNVNSSSNNNHNNENTRSDNITTDAARIAAIVTAAEQMKRAGEQIKEMTKGKGDQSKASGGSNGLLLLPPDENDPMDVPLDGGVTILVTAALGYGLRKTGILKRRKGDNSKYSQPS
jgi:hypothetical protein